MNEYYQSLFTQGNLSNIPDKEKIFRLIQEHKIEELKLFLIELSQMNRLSLELFEPIGVFDPLLYLKVCGRQDALDFIHSIMYEQIAQSISGLLIFRDQDIRIKICTGQRIHSFAGVTLWNWKSHEHPDRWIESILALAFQYEHHQVVDILCKCCPKFMLSAIREGNVVRVKELVEHGANPAAIPFDEARHRLSMNFFELAINKNQNEMAEYLIDHSMADIFAKDGNRGRVFAVACSAQNIKMLRYLCEKTKGNPGVVNIIKGAAVGAHHNRTALTCMLLGQRRSSGFIIGNGFSSGRCSTYG